MIRVTFLMPYGVTGKSFSGMLKIEFGMPMVPTKGMFVILPYGGEYEVGDVKYDAEKDMVLVFAREYLRCLDETDLKDRIRWLKENFKFVEQHDKQQPIALNLNLSDSEMKAVNELCEQKDLSREALIRQCLRQYQLTANGWTLVPPPEAELPPKLPQLSPSVPYEGKFIRIRKAGNWEFVERTNASGVVVIAALTSERKILFVEQFRPPLGCKCIELPAGLVGDKGKEKEEDAVRRELAEETGYELPENGRLLNLGQGCASAGLTNETASIYYAGGLVKMANPPKDESEQITLHEIPLEEAHNWLHQKRSEGFALDWKTFAALYFINLLLDRKAV